MCIHSFPKLQPNVIATFVIIVLLALDISAFIYSFFLKGLDQAVTLVVTFSLMFALGVFLLLLYYGAILATPKAKGQSDSLPRPEGEFENVPL